MKVKSRLNRFLRSLDAFGQPISFYIKGNTAYTTSFGGIITVGTLVIIMIISINSFINLTNKVNMTSTKETSYDLNPPYLNLTQQNFMFSIGIGDKDMKLNNSIFSFTALLITTNLTTNEQTMTPIALRPCKYEDYNNNTNDVARSYLQNFLCPDNFSYGIYDFYPNPIYRYLYITVNRCLNGTNPYITCASQDYIDNYLKNAGSFPIGFFFMNRIVELQNVNNPFRTFTDLQFWLIDTTDQVRPSTNLYLRLNQLSSYDDIFGISSPNIYSFITYEKERTDSAFTQTSNVQSYAQLNIYSSNYQNHYTRTYDNFLSILSYIGGISNLLIIFAKFIGGIYNNYEYKMKMFNKLYDFNFNECNIKKFNQINPIKANMSYNISSKICMNSEFSNSTIKQQFEEMKNLRSRLAFKISDFCQYIFCCYKSKLAKVKILLFKLADNRLVQDMDIIWLIKRIRDIDKLKTILLYPDKLKIFEFIPPPLISTDNHEKNQHDIVKSIRKNTVIKEEVNVGMATSDRISQNLDEYHKYRDAYINLKNAEDHTSSNIISCLNPEIVRIFECIEEISTSKQRMQVKEDNRPAIWTADDIFKQANFLDKKNNENKEFFIINQDSCRQLDIDFNDLQEKVMHESIQNTFQELQNFNSFDMQIGRHKQSQQKKYFAMIEDSLSA